MIHNHISRNSGTKVEKREIKWFCDICSTTERGWLWLPGGDYVLCPQCMGSGWITGEETRLTQSRKIILPTRISINA